MNSGLTLRRFFSSARAASLVPRKEAGVVDGNEAIRIAIASPNNATDHDRERGRGGGAREKPRNNPMRCRKLNTPKSPPRRSTRDPQLNCYPPSSSSATVARDCLISSAKPRLQVIASAV